MTKVLFARPLYLTWPRVRIFSSTGPSSNLLLTLDLYRKVNMPYRSLPPVPAHPVLSPSNSLGPPTLSLFDTISTSFPAAATIAPSFCQSCLSCPPSSVTRFRFRPSFFSPLPPLPVIFGNLARFSIFACRCVLTCPHLAPISISAFHFAFLPRSGFVKFSFFSPSPFSVTLPIFLAFLLILF